MTARGYDAADAAEAYGDDAILATINDAPHARPRGGLAFRKGISARALMSKTFAPIRWIVPGYVVEGMTVLAGAPKLGKSWLTLGWMLAVASGGMAMGSIECEQGDVLGLMLEDNERRLQRRLQQMRLTGLPERLRLVTDWPTLDDGCIEEMEAWIAGVENPRLIVIDVLARVKGEKRGKEDDYTADYRQSSKLQALASEHGIAVVCVHHTRKMSADDPFDEVSGTRGTTGASDSVLVLKRDSGGQPILYGRGRDLEEVETALQFDGETGAWSVLGAAWQVADTSERREIQQVLRRNAPDPMSPTEIADMLGKTRQNVQKMLTKMLAEGQVEKASTGRYVLVSLVSPVAPEPAVSTSTRETRETTSLHTRAREAATVAPRSAAAIEAAFMRCLDERNRQRRQVSEVRTTSNFAPRVFAKMPEAEGASVDALEAAMDRLFRAGVIEVGFLWVKKGQGKAVHGIRRAAAAANDVADRSPP